MPKCHRDIIVNAIVYDSLSHARGRAIIVNDAGKASGDRQDGVITSVLEDIKSEVEQLISHTTSLANGIEKLMHLGETLKRDICDRNDLSDEQKEDFVEILDTQIEKGIARLRDRKTEGAG